MNKQDILNAFREVLNKAKTFDEMQANAEQWLLNTLTEFEREVKSKWADELVDKNTSKYLGTTDYDGIAQDVINSISYESQLEKEKHT